MTRKQFLIYLLLCVCIIAQAQELTVKSFTESTDLISRVDERKDLNNRPCALIKVRVALRDVQFEGSVVGKPIYKTGEYWVYVPQGKPQLRVKHADYLPLDIHLPFGDEVQKIESNRVYILTLVIPVKESVTPTSGSSLIVNVLPHAAHVTVDGQDVSINANGFGSTLLSYGEHKYRIAANGYKTKSGTVNIGKDAVNLGIQLEHTTSSLSVTTSVENARIIINGKEKGTDSWSSKVEPGSYVVEIACDGFKSYRDTVVIGEDDKKNIEVNELSELTGSVRVTSSPDGASVDIDGKHVGTTPVTVGDLSLGSHEVSLSKDGYEPAKEKIKIKDDKEVNVQVTLNVQPKKETTPVLQKVGTLGTTDAPASKQNNGMNTAHYTPVYEKTRETEKLAGVYIEPCYQLLSYSGAGASVGGYISNFNIEAQYLLGMSKSDQVYWYDSDGNNLGVVQYKANRIALRAGYGIPIAKIFNVTPQVGVGIIQVSKSDGTIKDCDKSNAASVLVSARLVLSLTKNIQIAVTPEYSLGISKGKVFEEVSKNSKKMKAWTDGFNVRAGISIMF